LLNSQTLSIVSLFSSYNPQQISTPSPSPHQSRRILFAVANICNALIAVLLTIRYNTLIHPFTLADNRHYVFYVFRYTILRHPLIRFLLAPAYILSFYLSYLTLSNPVVSADSQSKIVTARPSAQNDGLKTSFILIFLLSTALSLITAPLVEPRYFILPWVIWRLHVPTSYSPRPLQKKLRKYKSRQSLLASFTEAVMSLAEKGGGLLLWGETFWFLLINTVTGYVFLYRGFEWPQEPGKVQRFMW
jgi:alpha-1,2-glucosyltransferase